MNTAMAFTAMDGVAKTLKDAAKAPMSGSPVANRIDAIATAMRGAQALFDIANTLFQATENDIKADKVEDVLMQFFRFGVLYDLADDARKEFGKKVEFMKNTLVPEKMDDAAVKSVTLQIGDEKRRFTLAQRVSCSMPEKDEGMQWLRENGHSGLITETVNSSSLSAFAKSYADDTGKDLPPDLFKMSMLRYTSITKA